MPGQPGLEAILMALGLGGQPLGNLGSTPLGVNPSTPVEGATQQQSQVNPAGGVADPTQAVAPFNPNPSQAAVDPVQQQQVEAILQALLGAGAGGFNLGGQPVG